MTGDETTATWPAFICRTDCSNSAARSRFASKAASLALERGLLFEGTANLLELGACEVVCLGLRVQREQHNLSFGGASEIDDPDAAGLAGTCATPTNLANATRPGHYIAYGGMLRNE